MKLLTQKDLAEKTGLTKQRISHIVNGITMKRANGKISEVPARLKESEDYIISDTGKKLFYPETVKKIKDKNWKTEYYLSE